MPRGQTKGVSIKKIFSSRLFLVGEVIILILFSVALGKELLRRQEIQGEITLLEKEMSRLEKEDRELEEFLQYIKTDAFVEKEARVKLGFGKPDEKLVIIPQAEVEEEPGDSLKEESFVSGESFSNPVKWWRYFFD